MHLNPTIEKAIRDRAESEGLSVEDLLSRTFGAGSPDAADQVRKLLEQWQTEDEGYSRKAVDAGPELFRQWEAADAEMTPEERDAEDQLWESVLTGLDETRAQLGMRPLRG